MKTLFVMLLGAAMSTACGVADTAATTAAIANAKKQELDNARATQARIEEQLQASQKASEDRLKAMEEKMR